MNNHIILDLCGGTGAWSRPYKEAGYDVRLVTLPEYDVSCYVPPERVWGILAAPPCTHFSFCRTNAKSSRDLRGGVKVVSDCLRIIWESQYMIGNDASKKSPLKFWALENPYYGMLKWFLGKPSFIFSPYQFGDPVKKKTALWGNFNIPLGKFQLVDDTQLCKFDRLENDNIYYHEGTKHFDRSTRRAITPTGFAKAFFLANP